MSTRDKLIASIAKFRAKHGICETTFGRLAMSDPNFVGDLVRGDRKVLSDTSDKVNAFMDGYDPKRSGKRRKAKQQEATAA